MTESFILSADDLSELIDCQICSERFTDSTDKRTPRLLTCCSAIACTSCLEILLLQKAPCFICRSTFINESGLDALPLCRVVVKLVETIDVCVTCRRSKFSVICGKCQSKMCEKCFENHADECLQKDISMKDEIILKKLKVELIREIFKKKIFNNCQMVQDFLENSSSLEEFNEWLSANDWYEGQTAEELVATMIKQILPKDVRTTNREIAVSPIVREISTMTMQDSKHSQCQTSRILTADNSTATSHHHAPTVDLSKSWLVSEPVSLEFQSLHSANEYSVRGRINSNSRTILVARNHDGVVHVEEYSIGVENLELTQDDPIDFDFRRYTSSSRDSDLLYRNWSMRNVFVMLPVHGCKVSIFHVQEFRKFTRETDTINYISNYFEMPLRQTPRYLQYHLHGEELIDFSIVCTTTGYNIYHCIRGEQCCFISLIKVSILGRHFGNLNDVRFGAEFLKNPVQMQANEDGGLYILDKNKIIFFKDEAFQYVMSLEPNCSGFACLEMADNSKLLCGLYGKEDIHFINYYVDENGTISTKFEYTMNTGRNTKYGGDWKISMVDNQTFVTSRSSTNGKTGFLVEAFGIKQDFIRCETPKKEKNNLSAKEKKRVPRMILFNLLLWLPLCLVYDNFVKIDSDSHFSIAHYVSVEDVKITMILTAIWSFILSIFLFD